MRTVLFCSIILLARVLDEMEYYRFSSQQSYELLLLFGYAILGDLWAAYRQHA